MARRMTTSPNCARPSRSKRGAQRSPAAVDIANHRVSVELHIVELQAGRLRAVDQRDIVDFEPGSIARHGEQSQAVRFASNAAGARRGDDHVRRSALNRELLGAVEDKAIALAPRFQRRLFRNMARTFVNRERKHRLARQDAGIPAIGMCSASDGYCCDNRSCEERRRCEVASDLFEHKCGLSRTKAEAALAFRDADARQAELGELSPQPVPEAVLAADVAPVAQLLGDASFLGKEARRRVLQHLLVVGEHGHAALSSLSP